MSERIFPLEDFDGEKCRGRITDGSDDRLGFMYAIVEVERPGRLFKSSTRWVEVACCTFIPFYREKNETIEDYATSILNLLREDELDRRLEQRDLNNFFSTKE